MSQEIDSFKEFNELIKKDPELPSYLEVILLRRYLMVCGNDPEKAFNLLRSNLQLRMNGSKIFFNRDVLSPATQAISKYVQLVPLPKLTEDNKRIVFIRFTTNDTSQFNLEELIKMILMSLDARCSMLDGDTLAESDISIIDLKHHSIRHLIAAAKNTRVLLHFAKYLDETVPIITKVTHILNASWIIDRFLSLIRPFTRNDASEHCRFHSKLETLHNFVPKELLPSEYGGNIGPIDDLHRDWWKLVESKRDYFLNDDNWKILK